MRKAKGLGTILILLIAAIVLSACSGKGGGNKIRLGEVTRSIFYAPLYVALSQDFFKDVGLEVEFQTIPGGDKVTTALLSDQIDIALVGAETSIYVYRQGTDDPLINFAQLTQTDGTFLVSRNKIDSFDWSMLKGSTFLGQRKGGMPQMAGEFTLKKHGIDPQQDLYMIQTVEFANIPSAFASGTGDFVQLFEPQATVFEKEGRGYVVASFGVESGRLPYTVFMTKQSYIKQHEANIQKFTDALYRAQQWVMAQSTNQIASAILEYFPETDESIIQAVVERYKSQGSYATDPIIDEEEWNNLQDIMELAGELDNRVAHSALVNNTFADKAMGK